MLFFFPFAHANRTSPGWDPFATVPAVLAGIPNTTSLFTGAASAAVPFPAGSWLFTVFFAAGPRNATADVVLTFVTEAVLDVQLDLLAPAVVGAKYNPQFRLAAQALVAAAGATFQWAVLVDGAAPRPLAFLCGTRYGGPPRLI